MSSQWLIYGATGFTGLKLVEAAVARGMRPRLAGRSAAKLDDLHHTYKQQGISLETKTARLDDPESLRAALQNTCVVLNAAGPYSQTAMPLVDACLATGTHYLDVSGEMPAITSIARRADDARAARVMLMPAVGYAVVPSDGLAVRACHLVPESTRLRIALSHFELFAAGSAKSMVGLVQNQVHVRRAGKMTTLPVGQLEADFDFGQGLSRTTAINWCDTFTAYFSTGVPNIEVYLEASAVERWLYSVSSGNSGLIQQPLVQALLGTSADLWFARRDDKLNQALEQRERCVIVEATDDQGQGVQLRMTTPDPYRVTCDCALAVVERIMGGQVQDGFCTPGMVYGESLLRDIANARVERRVL